MMAKKKKSIKRDSKIFTCNISTWVFRVRQKALFILLYINRNIEESFLPKSFHKETGQRQFRDPKPGTCWREVQPQSLIRQKNSRFTLTCAVTVLLRGLVLRTACLLSSWIKTESLRGVKPILSRFYIILIAISNHFFYPPERENGLTVNCHCGHATCLNYNTAYI